MRKLIVKNCFIVVMLFSILSMSLTISGGSNAGTGYMTYTSHVGQTSNMGSIKADGVNADTFGRITNNTFAGVNTSSADALSRISLKNISAMRSLRYEKEGMRSFFNLLFLERLKVAAFSLTLFLILFFVRTFLYTQARSLIRFIHAMDGKKKGIFMYS